MEKNNIDNGTNNAVTNKTQQTAPAIKRLDKVKESPPRKKSRERGER